MYFVRLKIPRALFPQHQLSNHNTCPEHSTDVYTYPENSINGILSRLVNIMFRIQSSFGGPSYSASTLIYIETTLSSSCLYPIQWISQSG